MRCLPAAVLAALVTAAGAEPITYQGRLENAGAPANGAFDLRFSLYDDATPGFPDTLYETITVSAVAVTDGVFTADLNFGDHFNGLPRWLSIEVRPAGGGAYTLLSPRQRLNDAPVARLAREAISANALTLPYSQSGPPSVANGPVFFIRNFGTNGYAIGGDGPTWGIVGTAGNYTTWPPVPVPTGVHGIGEAAGVGGSSADGAGVLGITTNGIGGEFTVFSSANPGDALHASTAGSGHAGIFSKTQSSGTNPALLVTNASTSNLAFGVHSIITPTSPGGSSTALRGENRGTGPLGIGVWGTHQGTGWGVYGTAGGAGRGVYGVANSAGGSGVYGTGTGGANAATFIGNVSVSGTLSKGSGTFRIDHPLDPENRYLSHSFVESPEMKNIYDGVVTLDESGRAAVIMPDYFDALNRDFRYQLTCVGRYAPVYIEQELADRRFIIAGGTPGLKVSWQVTGVRQDPFALANPVRVEEEKSDADKGRYLHPAAYGLLEERGIGFTPAVVEQ
jgi:hypothetical protein